MPESEQKRSLLSPSQERRWFRLWVIGLISFFIVSGGASLVFLWRARHAEADRHRRLLDEKLPDPGVTEAAVSAKSDATVVEVGYYVERIPELVVREASWTVEFDVWFRWRGEKLSPASGLIVVEGTIESKEKLAEFHMDESHYERYRIIAKISKPFPAARVPLDSHLLLIAVENGELPREKFLFAPDIESCGVSSRVSITGYNIKRWQVLEKAHSYQTTRGDPRLPNGTKSTFSQFRMGIEIKRASWGLYLKLFQALHIAVAIAFLACFIKPTDVDPRFGLGVGALFAAVANSYVISSLVPDTGDFSLADVVNGLGILTIMVTLVESTMSLYLYDRCGETELSARLDRVSFKILVAGFAVVNVVLFAAAAL